MRQGMYKDYCQSLKINNSSEFGTLCFRKSMAFYRGKEFHSQEIELQSIVEREANRVSSNPNTHFWGRLQILKTTEFLRPFKCVGVIYILMHMSGISIILSYTAIFLEARQYLCLLLFAAELILISKTQAASGKNFDIPPQKQAIFLGASMLSASLTAPFIIMKVPKKMLFIVSGSIASLSQAASKILWQVMNVFVKLQLFSCFLQLLSSITCQKPYLNMKKLICMTTFHGYLWWLLFWLSLAQDV